LKPSSAAAPLLSAHDLHKSFGARPVLNDVSVTIGSTERVGLVGDNGSGKSTLAKVLAGVEAPDRGEVMRQRGARIAFLDQVPVFDPERSAFDTVAEGQPQWQATKREYDAVAQKLAQTEDAAAKEQLLQRQAELGVKLEHLGGWDQEHKIKNLLEHLSVPDPYAPMRQLSGGEQRRVALAQQLLAAPDLLILDEPTNHLDTETIDWLEE
jgi:ATP-binding cassette subfamily F protein uup